MLKIYVLVITFFTSVGPGSLIGGYSIDREFCETQAAEAAALVGQKVPGPDNEPTLVLDAQGKCVEFTQGAWAKAEKK